MEEQSDDDRPPSARLVTVEYRLSDTALDFWADIPVRATDECTDISVGCAAARAFRKESPGLYEITGSKRGLVRHIEVFCTLQEPIKEVYAQYLLRLFAEELSPLFRARVYWQDRLLMHSFREDG